MPCYLPNGGGGPPLLGSFVLVPTMFRCSPGGGFLDAFVAVFLQRVNLGGKAAEHVNDLGIFFGVGSQLLSSLRVEQHGRELGGGDLETDFGKLAGVVF